ncbi:MAG: substrate-binding domain-containing protein [Rhodospirillaceae bacterium]|nr:substrate-binding domain-containing protein [Rhodospirillaceae bacterium]
MRKGWLAAAAMGFGLALAAQAAWAAEKYVYLHHATPTNVFWQAVKKGMDEACAQIQADCQMVFLQQDGNFQEQLNNLEAAIAQKPDGIIMTFAGGEIFDEAIDRAMKAGIPVIASNVDHPKKTHRLAFVGQDLEQAGYDLAAGLAPQFPKEGPIHVLIGISGPGQVWAESRGAGIARFMEDYKKAHPDRQITYEKIDSGLDLSVTGQRVAAYVQSKPTTAYFDVGYWAAGAAVSLRDLGKKPGEILLACFDLVPVVMDEMKSGYIQLTIDQQPFLQGYIPIHELHLINKYKLSAYDVNTGKALVTPDQVDALIKLSQEGVR